MKKTDKEFEFFKTMFYNLNMISFQVSTLRRLLINHPLYSEYISLLKHEFDITDSNDLPF